MHKLALRIMPKNVACIENVYLTFSYHSQKHNCLSLLTVHVVNDKICKSRRLLHFNVKKHSNITQEQYPTRTQLKVDTTKCKKKHKIIPKIIHKSKRKSFFPVFQNTSTHTDTWSSTLC